MAQLQGVKPTVNVLDVSNNNLLKNMDDQQRDNACVKMLLNSYDSVEGVPQDVSNSLGNDFNLITSSNKSLMLTSTEIPPNSVPVPVSAMSLAQDVSNYILYKEKFRYKLESPDDGVSDLLDSENVTLKYIDMKVKEVDAYASNIVNKNDLLYPQDAARYYDTGKILARTKFGQDALFVNDKVAVKTESSEIDSLVSGNSDTNTGLTLSMQKTDSNPENYAYGSGLVSYDGSKLTITNTDSTGNLVNLDGSAIEQKSSVDPSSVLGNNYKGGQYGEENYANLTSFELELTVSNDDGVTQCFTSTDNSVMLEPTQTQVNVDVLGENFPKSNVAVSTQFSLSKYPKKDSNEVQDVLERVPLDSTTPEYLTKENANTSSVVTISNKDVSNRMSGLNSVVNESRVIFQDSEKVNSLNTVLSNSNRDGDVSFQLDVLEQSTLDKYVVKDNSYAVTSLLSGSMSERNIVFSISEVKNVEVADDIASQNSKLTNLNDEKSPLDLDLSQTGVGADITSESFINVSLLRNNGLASADVNDLRLLFKNRLSDEALMIKRDSQQQQVHSEDSITKITMSASSDQSMVPSSCSASFEVVPNFSAPYRWSPSLSSENLPLDLINKNALALKVSFLPYFDFGGPALQQAVAASNFVDSNGKKIYLPDPKSINLGVAKQALSRDSNGDLVYEDVNPELAGFDINEAKVELVSTDLVAGVRTVSAKITHLSTLPTLKNHQVSYILTYKYNEQNNKWDWYSPSQVLSSKGSRPQPVVTLEVNSKFVFSHSATLQGFSESGGSWTDLPNQNNVVLSLSQNYSSDLGNQLVFSSNDSAFNVQLNIYFDNKPASADILNNKYALSLVSVPGNWVCKYLELTDSNMAPMNDLLNIKELINEASSNGLLKDLQVTSSRNPVGTSSKTTLTVSDVFKVEVPNSKLSDMVGYKMSDSWVSMMRVENNVVKKLLVKDNSWLHLDDGIYAKVASLSAAPKGMLALLSLLNDEYSCSFPYLVNQDIPNDKVLIKENQKYGRGVGDYFKQVTALHRRGLMPGAYTFERQSVKAKAVWGSLVEEIDLKNDNVDMYLDKDANNYYFKAAFNFGNSVNMNLIINSKLGLDNSLHTLYIHYSKLSSKLMKVYNQEVLSELSLSTMNTLGQSLGLPLVLPFVERFRLSNFFAKNQTVKMSMSNNSSIKVHFFNKYSWANGELQSLDKDGLKAAALNGQADRTVTFTENQFILSNNQTVSLNEGKTVLKINYTPKLRSKDAYVCFSCIPEVLSVGNNLIDNVEVVLKNKNPSDVNLKVRSTMSNSASNVTHTLSIASLDSSQLALGTRSYFLNTKPLLLTLQGSKDINDPWDDPLIDDVWSSYSTYLNKISFTEGSDLTLSFDKQKLRAKVTQSLNSFDGYMSFNWNVNATRLADVWSGELIASPKIITKVIQYVLSFDMNDGVIKPVVQKLTSVEFNPNKLNNSSKLNSGNSLIKVPVATVKKSDLNIDMAVLDFPHNYTLAGQNYPSVSASDLTNVNMNFVNLPTNSPTISNLDIMLKFNDTGLPIYQSWFGPKSTGINKIINVQSRDQLVLKDAFGNLCMRVGPDGRLYVGDVSTYTVYCNAQNSVLVGDSNKTPVTIGGLTSLAFNNNVVQNSMVQ